MWPKYLTEEDFISSNHLEALKSIQWYTPATGWDIIKTSISKEGTINITSSFSSKPATSIPSEKILLSIYNTYQNKMLDILKQLAPEKYDSFSHTELNIVSTGKDYFYRIHNDIEDKILSGVVYISPEENVGTILYDTEKGENKREIVWKPKKLFIFSRNNDSWHSYESNGITNRVALVYNLKGFV